MRSSAPCPHASAIGCRRFHEARWREHRPNVADVTLLCRHRLSRFCLCRCRPFSVRPDLHLPLMSTVAALAVSLALVPCLSAVSSCHPRCLASLPAVLLSHRPSCSLTHRPAHLPRSRSRPLLVPSASPLPTSSHRRPLALTAAH